MRQNTVVLVTSVVKCTNGKDVKIRAEDYAVDGGYLVFYRGEEVVAMFKKGDWKEVIDEHS